MGTLVQELFVVTNVYGFEPKRGRIIVLGDTLIRAWDMCVVVWLKVIVALQCWVFFQL